MNMCCLAGWVGSSASCAILAQVAEFLHLTPARPLIRDPSNAAVTGEGVSIGTITNLHPSIRLDATQATVLGRKTDETQFSSIE